MAVASIAVQRSRRRSACGRDPRDDLGRERRAVLARLDQCGERFEDAVAAVVRIAPSRRGATAPRSSRASRRCPASWRAPCGGRSARTARSAARARRAASRRAQRDDRELLVERRVVDVLVQAAAAQRVGDLARAVGRDDDERHRRRRDRAELGDRHLEVRQQLEQVRLERLVGAVDLVDQQHRRRAQRDRLEQRPLQQVALGEDVLLLRRRRCARPARAA